MRPSLLGRAGVEDLDALDLGRRVEPFDHRALAVAAGIALRRHHHRERRVGKPAQIEIAQLPFRRRQQRRHDVRHQPQHQHLALGIAEADVVFDQLRPRRRDHQPEIEHAGERHAHLLHRRDRRQHELVHGAAFHRRRHDRHRRIGAHAAGVGALVAVEHALVVLRGDQRDRGLAVAEREERRLLAVEEFLDHHLGAGVAQAAAEHHVDRRFRLGHGLRHHHALAGGKAVGLDHDRRALGAHIGLGRRRRREPLVGGGRNAVVAAEVLGEPLGGLELGRRPARPERLDPGRREGVDDALAHRPLRPDHDQVDFVRAAERDHRRMVARDRPATSSPSRAMPALPGVQ